ncbi:hypothetical protein EDD11_004838 [Mortierella claussenii]|nr:hypothetical protein EDD11_004838 [Mortierella claussenii]
MCQSLRILEFSIAADYKEVLAFIQRQLNWQYYTFRCLFAINVIAAAMETKKRPNDDTLKAESTSSTDVASVQAQIVSKDADAAGPAPMDVDASISHTATTSLEPDTLTAASNVSVPVSVEAHKRLKLMVEADPSGSEYSASTDVTDPSKEIKGLSEWIGNMEKHDSSIKDAVDLSVLPNPERQVSTASNITHDATPPTSSKDHMPFAGAEEPIDKEPTKGPETSALEQSTGESAMQDTSDSNAIPSASQLTDSILAVASLSEPLVITLETLENESVPASDNSVVSSVNKSTSLTINPQLSLAPVESNTASKVDEKAGNREELGHTIAQPDTAATGSTSTKGPDKTAHETTANKVALEMSDKRSNSEPDMPNQPLRVQNMPKVDQPSITTEHVTESPQQPRPSRSTMSVSALLLNNDDTSERDQDDSNRRSRSIFDPFEGSEANHAPLAPPAPSQLGLAQPFSHPVKTTSDPSASSAIARSGSAGSMPAGSSVYGQVILDHGLVSTRGYDTAIVTPTHVSQRGTSNRDYSIDEVMDSGGVSGYGHQQPRLSSPLGIRPVQDTINGSGSASGSGSSSSHNQKIPGLGFVTGTATTQLQDPLGLSIATFRDDDTSSSASGRPVSHSPNQRSTLTHAVGVNGHAPYPSTPSHSGHALAPLPSQPPQAASVNAHGYHPRLVVNNDLSLKMDDRPEFFLGYYRYDPSVLLPDMQGRENSLLEIRVASSYLTYDNVKVKRRELWGTDVYTDDSDVVSMLIHGGLYIPPLSVNSGEQDTIQPTSQKHNFVADPIKRICPGYDLAVTLRVLPKLVKYQGSIRHRIKSRTWSTGHDGVSLRIESVRKLCSGEALNRGRSQSKRRMKEYGQERLRVLANIHDETTESLQNERAMRTATFEFTHQGDPCFKYSPELVMDRHDGLSRKWTSWRLKKEVMILENDEERYEISLQHQAGMDDRRFDQYRFAVISPRTSLSSWSKASYPLDTNDLTEILYEDLDWQDFEWVERGVVVQPSQRSKRSSAQGHNNNNSNNIINSSSGNHKSNSMEGIHDIAEIRTSVYPSNSAQAMDMEDEPILDDTDKLKPGPAGGTVTVETSLSAPSFSLGGPDTQQDGVFCVVSRLFWRPISEPRATKSVSAVSYNTAEVKAVNGMANATTTELYTLPMGSKTTTLASAAASAAAAPAVVIPAIIPAIKPSLEQTDANVGILSADEVLADDAAYKSDKASNPTDIARDSVDSFAPTMPTPEAPATRAQVHPGPSAMEMDPLLHPPVSQSAAAEHTQLAMDESISETNRVSRSDAGTAASEEGELEEGEIASD